MITSTKCFVLSNCGRKVAPALGNNGWRKEIAEIQVTSLQRGQCCAVSSFEEDPRRCEGLDLA